MDSHHPDQEHAQASALIERLERAGRTDAKPDDYTEALAAAGQQAVFRSLQQTERVVRACLAQCGDIVYRGFTPDLPGRPRALLLYLDGLVDKNTIDRTILNSLMLQAGGQNSVSPGDNLAAAIRDRLLPQNYVSEADKLNAVFDGILRGMTALFIDGIPLAFLCSTQGWESRGVQEPVTEGLVRGPRDGFTETLRTNTALLRLRLPTPALKIEELKIGRLTRTKVAVAYIAGVANPLILAEVRKRLERIDIDGVLESGYLEEYLEDTPWSPFPQIEHTERPDKTAGALLDGRVAIFTNNTPFVLLAPTTMAQFLLSTEDYYERFWFGTSVRWIRIFAWHFSLLLPALYVAVTTYQTELIPSTLLFSLAAAREGIPFPAVVEALLMEIALEVLREAGVRLPRPVGQAVSIVGGLVIGDAAVRAGIASPAMVIVVAFTAIASFAIPAYGAMHSVRMLRFVMILLAATLGLPGIMWGVLALQIHLNCLRSFGVPYLSPFSPTNYTDLKDIVVRVPWWAMRRRPRLTGGQNRRRQPSGQMPSKSQGK